MRKGRRRDVAYIGAKALEIFKDNCREQMLAAECEAYSAAAREGIAHRWWKIGLDEPMPEPDYACGGVETSEPCLAEWLRDMGLTREPDLMSAIRDIARGS